MIFGAFQRNKLVYITVLFNFQGANAGLWLEWSMFSPGTGSQIQGVGPMELRVV